MRRWRVLSGYAFRFVGQMRKRIRRLPDATPAVLSNYAPVLGGISKAIPAEGINMLGSQTWCETSLALPKPDLVTSPGAISAVDRGRVW